MMTNLGLILDFIGIIFLLHYSFKTEGTIDKATKDYLVSSKWQMIGYVLLGIGFILQLIGNNINSIKSLLS